MDVVGHSEVVTRMQYLHGYQYAARPTCWLISSVGESGR